LKIQEFNEPSGINVPDELCLKGSEIQSYFNLWDRDVNPTSFLVRRMVYPGIKL